MNQKRKRRTVARAVEPNAGRKQLYTRKLKKFLNDFNRMVYNELLEELLASEILAYDDSISNPRTVEARTRLKLLKAKIDSLIRRNPLRLREVINEIIAKRMVKWLDWAEKEIYELVSWYVKNCAYEISASMRKAFMSAGISPQIFKERWKLPTVNQYISPNALAKLPSIIDEQTALITQMTARDLGELREVMTECVMDGRDFADIEATLFASEGFNADRARRVALDQTLKLNQAIQVANAQSLGIEQGIWIHVPGQYSSRETHIEMDGKLFDLDTGLYDEQVGYNVLPAELYNCRCIWRAVIPDDYLGIPQEIE